MVHSQTFVAVMFRAVLLLAAVFHCAWDANAQAVFINELHYDNDGTDSGEAIEIAGPAGTDLTGWSIVLYNGNGGTAYDTRVLSGSLSDVCGEFGVLVETYPSNGIQNGDMDGIALVDGSGGVVQFISYEGTLTAVGGRADGMTSTALGVEEASDTPEGYSLQLGGNGFLAHGFQWQSAQPSTFGACNANQQFVWVGYLRNDAVSNHDSGITLNEVSARSAAQTDPPDDPPRFDYNADDSTSTEFDKDEFVEIVNSSIEPIDINGWILADNFDAFTLSNLQPLGPNESVVVFTRGSDVSNFDPGDGNQAISVTDLALDNEYDAVGLRNSDGLFIAVYWGHADSTDSQLVPLFTDGASMVGANVNISRPDTAISKTRIPDFVGDWGDHEPMIGTFNWSVDGTVQLTDPQGSPGRTVLGTVLDVEEPEIPVTAWLHQNYPNPFNPSTEIAFTLSNSQHVRLHVVDLLGREVAVLTDGFRASEAHHVTFYAANLSSGLYLYRLETAGQTVTRKMVLLR